ncbi:MAG: hypothetical protein JW779_14780 [Candidatus Thorarchaeota archaeon]|nr:hypothetical protein [Candidatus Thorarchaeota archaeon]
MVDRKEMLIKLVMERDISSIQVMADDLLTDEDTIRNLLEELVSEGKLKGYITADGRRFFRRDVSPPSKELKHEDVPEFMKYNTAPGKYTALIGIIIMIVAGTLLSLFSGIIYYENMGVSLLLIGIAITLTGCCYIGRRKTPM